MPSRILIVDDEETLATSLSFALTREGYEVCTAADGLAALRLFSEQPADLVLLDLMLPAIDGIEVCRRIRATSPVPIIMLTAKDTEVDKILGLELGADDYVTKPFSPRELALRVESVLRRVSAGPSASAKKVLTAGDITVDAAARRATRNGTELALTVRELDLLTFLMSHPGQAFNREQLMREVWGWTFGDQSTVTVHVRRLREKVEDDPTNPKLIQTVWGIGYRLEIP
jgi:two-component system, OmpR family, response regulator ResD